MAEPWVRFEDEHLLVVHKPAGVTTHRADAHAQDGMYDWVQRQRPGASLSILHRLDKATSGLLLFGKSTAANRSLTQQFADRTIAKRYVLLTAAGGGRPSTRHLDAPVDGRPATTELARETEGIGVERWTAVPHTGRTHQVRVHAETAGLPVLGDDEHGGAPAARLFLHAAALGFDHPADGRIELVDEPPASFDRVLAGDDPAGSPVAVLAAHEARAALFDPADTDAYVWIDRQHDGFPGVRVERLGPVALVVRSGDEPGPLLDALAGTADMTAVFELDRPRGGGGEPARPVAGTDPGPFTVNELGRRYLIDLSASATSTGLFLDQRETRRRLLTSDLKGRTVLNAFAHTGSLSVAAATAGAETLTLDLSPRYLDWARDNLRLNDLDPADQDFVYGDALEWMERLARKGRTFDLVLVDPPSSSTTRKGRKRTRWSVERDLTDLVARAVRLAAPGGTVFVSTNLRRLRWDRFLTQVDDGLAAAGRSGAVEPQTLPLDFRSGPGDPPYLKAAWVVLDV